MPKLPREYVLPAVLAGIALVLGFIVALEALVLDRKRQAALVKPQSQAAPPMETGSGGPESLELPPLDDYRQIADRPLFMESRRPGSDMNEPPPPPEVRKMPMTLKLMGIVHTPEGRKALLVDAKGKYKRLKAQDTLDSWTLVDVGVDRVVMQQGQDNQELPLLKKKPKAAVPPGQPGQPQAQPAPPGKPPRPGRPPMPVPQPVEEPEEEPMPPEEEDTGVEEEYNGGPGD